MQFNILAIAAFAATAMADYNPCGSGLLYGEAVCCATDVLGVADLDCNPPSAVPGSPDEFRATCAETGAEPKCCTLDVATLALLCQDIEG